MASPAWLPQEMQSSGSQTSVMSSVTGGPTPGSSTTNSDSTQEAAQEKIIPPPDYNVTGSISPGSSASLQPPVPGKSASVGPSFSYNISKADNSFSSGIQFSSNTLKAPEHAVDGKNSPSPAASLQPPLPLVSTRLSSFTPGTTAPSAPPISVSNLSFKGNLQMVQTNQIMKPNTRVDVAQEMGAMTSAPSVMQPFSQAAYMSSGSSTAAFPTSYVGTPTIRMPHAPQFQVPVGVPKSPVTPGPPGLRPAIPSSSNLTATASSGGSSLSFRPNVPPAPIPANPHVQQQTYSHHFPATLVVPSNQGLWLQPAPVTTMLRPPFSSYPAPFTAPFPLSATGAPLPSVILPDPQPPGVTSVAAPPGVPTTVSQSPGSGLQPELLPGVDSGKHVNTFDRKEGASTSEQRDTWTAHRTETGAIYYYNSLTGESTYEKPAGFMGEPGKVAVQPAPVSWEKLSCTDWALVTTNDGQKYYYNTRTKVSSWQIPSEVTEFKKKHDADALQAQSMSVPNANALTEKGSAPLSLSIPAVNTGGRDATTLRASVLPGSSALDLVKKKLMDSGAPPVVASPTPALSGALSSEANGTKALESTVRAPQRENSRENDNSSESSSDSEDGESVPAKDDCIIQFKVMLKERGVAPFSKWERELPKILFDPRFKAVPSYSTRKALFEHYVKTRADEERKEKRAAQKAAVEGFKQLLEEAKEDISRDTDYQSFKKKWGHDPRFESLDRKERESLLNERVHKLRKAAQEKTQALRTASISQFKSMLRERGDITLDTRWSKVKDSLRNDPRYKSVKHEDKEALFNEYLSEIKAAEQEVARIAKAKYDEEEKLKERERALRKRKEREEQEVERVRLKARRKEAVESYQALLVEIIKDPQASWTESKPKLEKDPQGRAANPHLDQSDLEKLFREHVKILYERSAQEFKALLAEVITAEACTRETEGGKTVANSWSTAKQVLKADPRCSKVPRKDRESLWRRHVEDIQRRQKVVLDEGDKPRSKSSADSRRR